MPGQWCWSFSLCSFSSCYNGFSRCGRRAMWAVEGRPTQRFLCVCVFVFACRLPWFMYACIGAAVGLLLVGVLFLIMTTVSARLTGSRPFVSSRKLHCVRATNCVVRYCTRPFNAHGTNFSTETLPS